MAVKVERQSSKFIKPFNPTPSTLGCYRIGLIDEFAPLVHVGMVIFFSPTRNHDPKFVAQLETSLEKTLTHLYPLAGRYADEIQAVDCNDEGVQFIHAKVNIQLQEFLDSKLKDKLVDEFIPFKSGVAHLFSDPLLVIQVTMFDCGGVAVGVSIAHKIADASTLCTFLNQWACINREENDIKFERPGFNSSSFFPPHGVRPPPPMSACTPRNYTRKKLSFSESEISRMKAKAITGGKGGTHQFSKVQLVSAIIWKALIEVDRAKNNYTRESILIQPVNLREKIASLIPNGSCGNLLGCCVTKSKILATTEELANLLRDSIEITKRNYSKVYHDSEEGQTMVLNSYLDLANILESTNVIMLSSWCKFPFYEADFGFGKPIWVTTGTVQLNNSACLMDDAQGNGVEAYVSLDAEDVPYFEKAIDVNVFGLSG